MDSPGQWNAQPFTKRVRHYVVLWKHPKSLDIPDNSVHLLLMFTFAFFAPDKSPRRTVFNRCAPRICCLAATAALLATASAATAQNVVADPPLPATLPDSGHGAPLVALAYSPDGALLWTLDAVGELRGRAVEGGATVFRGNAGEGASKLRVASDGSLFVGRGFGAVTWYDRPVAGKPLVRRRAFKGEEVDKQQVPKPDGHADNSATRPLYALRLEDFALSPDGSRLLMLSVETAWKDAKPQGAAARTSEMKSPGAQVARLRVWDVQKGTLVHEWDAMPMDKEAPRVAWAGAGTVVVGLPEVGLRRFDAQSGALKSEWKPAAGAATQIDPAVQDAETKRRLEMLPERLRERAMRAAERRKAENAANPKPLAAPDFGTLRALSPDGTRAVAHTRNGWQLWDTTSNANRILERSERLSAGEDAAFSRDGALLAVRTKDRFWLWRSDGTQIGWANVPFAAFADMAFAPDGASLSLADGTGVARRWTTASPLAKTAQQVFPGFFQPWNHFSATPDGLLAATAEGVASIDASGKLVKWHRFEAVESPAALPEYMKTQTRLELLGLVASPDGKSWVESLGYDTYTATMDNLKIPRGELRVRDAATGAILWRRTDLDPYQVVQNYLFLADGTLVTGKPGLGRSASEISESFGGLQAHDGRTGEPAALDIAWEDKVGFRQPRGIEILEKSPDDKYLLVSSGSGGGGLQVVDLAAKKVIGYSRAHSTIHEGRWLLSPDAKFLVRAGNDAVGVWAIARDGKPGSTKEIGLFALDSPAQSARFAPDGSLAVGLRDGRIKVWAAFSGDAASEAKSLDATPLWETARGRQAVVSLEFSRDGKTLWSGDARGDLSSRDARTGQWRSTLRLAPPKGADAPASWVRWARDGKVESG